MEMDILTLLRESLVLIVVVLALLMYTMVRGRHALVSVILGLYIALLISLKFPYYDELHALTSSSGSDPVLNIILFALFTLFGTFLFQRLLPDDAYEAPFEQFGRKLLLALLGAGLIMAYSYHVLPITTLIEPGTPASMLFAPEGNFFWWLIIPLLTLFLV